MSITTHLATGVFGGALGGVAGGVVGWNLRGVVEERRLDKVRS